MNNILSLAWVMLMSVIIAGCSDSSADIQNEIPQPIEQSITERRFVELPTEIIATFGADEDAFYPEEVRVSKDGDVYISIGKAGRIQRYSPSGELLKVFGKGPGSGPGEFDSIRNFGIDPAGRVWAHDFRQRRLTVFSPDGALLSTFNPEAPFSQMVVSESGMIGYYGFENPFFTTVDSDGKILNRFGTLADDVDEIGTGLKFVGYMKTAPSGKYFAYVPMNNGKIVSYDSHGNLRFYRHSLGGPVSLELKRTKNGDLTYDFSRIPLRFQQIALNVWNDVLYLITTEHINDEAFLDAYDMDNGDYLYSMRVPFDGDDPCGPDFVTDTTMYMLCDSATSLVSMKRVD